MPLDPNDKKPLPVFTVQVTCSRQWGNHQQNHLDELLVWSAHLSPEIALKLLERIKAEVNKVLPGALAPTSQSAAATLDALGKEKQLSLPACELK